MDIKKFWDDVESAGSIGIAGHIRPDGDCLGSCLGLYGYLRENYPEKEIKVFAESIPESFKFLKYSADLIFDYPEDIEPFELFISLDCGDLERLGKAARYVDQAKKTYCFDHHITNKGFCDENYILPNASATAEVMMEILDYDRISSETAAALYLGIVHDTGVFKHSNTTRKTMEMAGVLIEKGAKPNEIIDRTFYEKTYMQNQLLGRCLMESLLVMDGRVIISSVPIKMQKFYGATSADLEGVIDQLRITKGVEVAILLKQFDSNTWKISLRSNSIVDVGQICADFGGGGHVRAAGCTLKGSVHDCINNLTRAIEKQMPKAK